MTPELNEVQYLRQLLDEERSKNAVLTAILFEHLGILPSETNVQIGGNPDNQILSRAKHGWPDIRRRLELKHKIDKVSEVTSTSLENQVD